MQTEDMMKGQLIKDIKVMGTIMWKQQIQDWGRWKEMIEKAKHVNESLYR